MAKLTHFAINADDVEATRAFYQALFGWEFQPWGPPGFLRIDATDPTCPGVTAAIQQRRDLIAGTPTVGFECTVAVDDVEAAEDAAVAAGGQIIAERATIPTVGQLTWLADPSGNIVGIMQYEPGRNGVTAVE
jgi:predicted enzyme related to lactoylglutathione lyase